MPHATANPSSPDNKQTDLYGIYDWLESFSLAVRNKDYISGRELFDPDVYAFGSRTAVLDGLDELVAEQWSHIWNQTRGFTLLTDQMHCGIDGDSAWVAVPWTSQGFDSARGWFDRLGRATYILARRGGRWLAVHSHHSLNPKSPAAR